MRKNLLLYFLLWGLILLATQAKSQSNHLIYAITDIQKEGSNWTYLRKLDLQSAQYSEILLNSNDIKQIVYDAATQKQIENFPVAARNGYSTQPAFSSGVAAIAYDIKNNRLYYTPMYIDQLRFIDLQTMKVYYITNQPFTGMPLPDKSSDQGNVVTRMTIGNDGNIYSITNNATHLISFSTGKNLNITDFGTLVDNPANKGISIFNSCSGYGGDIIADDEGNLIVITASNQVFKVNIATRVATYSGVISGLPANFTTNGAAVNDNNKIIVSSALNNSSYFVVDPATWSAVVYNINGDLWRSSDLASSNVLNTGKTLLVTDFETPDITSNIGTNKIHIYPNPVTNNQFYIQFSQLNTGNYTIQITDVLGRQVAQQVVNINSEEQSENIKLNPNSAKGIYLIKITGHSNKSVFAKKIVVQ